MSRDSRAEPFVWTHNESTSRTPPYHSAPIPGTSTIDFVSVLRKLDKGEGKASQLNLYCDPELQTDAESECLLSASITPATPGASLNLGLAASNENLASGSKGSRLARKPNAVTSEPTAQSRLRC
jgi:hypothetical protein